MKRCIKLFILILLPILFIIFVFSIYNLIVWKIEDVKTEEIIEEINNVVNPPHQEENPQNTTNNSNEVDLNNIDFSKLKEMNIDTVGWLDVKGTNISYPFVQTTNNDYYLNHSFDKSKNNSGWLFLDYRNNQNEFEKNNIIYGHNVGNGHMFGTLYKTLNRDWQNNKSLHAITIVKEKSISYWEPFSVYTIQTTSDYIQTYFQGDNDFTEFINLITNRSNYNFNVKVNASDKILTLSTCYRNSKNRIVLHAKLTEEVKIPN